MQIMGAEEALQNWVRKFKIFETTLSVPNLASSCLTFKISLSAEVLR